MDPRKDERNILSYTHNIHRHGLSHMHHKIDLKHQLIDAFVVFGVYIWFTSEKKCFVGFKELSPLSGFV